MLIKALEFIVMVPRPPPAPAEKYTFSGFPLLPEMTMLMLTIMLPSAPRNSEAGPPAVWRMLLVTLMSPFCEPVALPPVTICTVLPPSSAAMMGVTSMAASSPLGVKVLDTIEPLAVVPLMMLTFSGSSSQVPGFPAAAAASTLPNA